MSSLPSSPLGLGLAPPPHTPQTERGLRLPSFRIRFALARCQASAACQSRCGATASMVISSTRSSAAGAGLPVCRCGSTASSVRAVSVRLDTLSAWYASATWRSSCCGEKCAESVESSKSKSTSIPTSTSTNRVNRAQKKITSCDTQVSTSHLVPFQNVPTPHNIKGAHRLPIALRKLSSDGCNGFGAASPPAQKRVELHSIGAPRCGT